MKYVAVIVGVLVTHVSVGQVDCSGRVGALHDEVGEVDEADEVVLGHEDEGARERLVVDQTEADSIARLGLIA